MKKNLLLVFSTVMLHSLFGQKIGIEHYVSYTSSQPIENSTLIFVEHGRAIAEVEHDIDAPGVFSVNVGRSFYFGNEKLNFVIKPMIGLTIGSTKGINLNLDQEIELNSLYLSADLEYFFSRCCKSESYFYTWFESGISFSEKFFGGVSLQATFANKCFEMSKGFVVGFSARRWNFPVYIYEPFNRQRNIVAGVFYNLDFKKRPRHHFDD